MEEQFKKALLDTIQSKISDLNYQKEQVVTKGKNLDKLSELASVLEAGFESLKDYSRNKLEEILTPYYTSNIIKEELDKLEIVRFVFDVKGRGHNLELNEEEIDIMVNFIDKIKNERNIEYQKYEKISLKNKEQLEEEIQSLVQIEEKISLGEKGNKVIIGREIDKIMQLAIEDDANESIQISILCLLNKMNLGISKNSDKETI